MRHVSLEISDGMATITLQRPESLNAFTDFMEAQLLEALDTCDDDAGVRAVILTGAGRAFCAGMDLSAARPRSTTGATAPVRRPTPRSTSANPSRCAATAVAGSSCACSA
jgi:enoyl-CoA hydratase/carnithine racemase